MFDDKKGWFTFTMRKLLRFPLAALLGAAIVVLPALAASSEPPALAATAEAKLEVQENCNGYTEWPCWTVPGGSPQYAPLTTIAAGDSVTFADNHTATNIAWTGAAPTCAASVPVSPAPAKTGWEGSCTFEAPGSYKFESASLYSTYRKYEIVVSAPGTTPTGPTTSTGAGSGAEGGATNPNGSSSSGSGSSTSGSGSQTAPVEALLVGSASSAVKLPSSQRGQSVHGSVDVSQAAAGGRLEVRLLATRASLAAAGHSSHVQVGGVARSSLHAGTARFVVAVDAKAKHAMRLHGHLTLSVKILLTSVHGSVATITRSVVLRP